MKKKTNRPANSLSIHLRLRVVGPEKIALGPGKAELLELIEQTGSLIKAARRMEMSYMKAWTLTQTMKPLVALTRGGRRGGGAALTSLGKLALTLYRQMELASRDACADLWREFQQLARAGAKDDKPRRSKG